MKIYAMSDIHGCLFALNEALDLFVEKLDEDDTKLIFLGDYVHGGEDNRGVLDKIISLQNIYGDDKVIALMGNHDLWVIEGRSTIDKMVASTNDDEMAGDNLYYSFIDTLPYYHKEGNTIFVHAGIDEQAGEYWEWDTSEKILTMKYPAEIGQVKGITEKIVAGHVGTSDITNNRYFHDIYYDGYSHYYIDGSVLDSGVIPVLMVDTETDTYYRVTESGNIEILPYDEEN